MFTLEIKVNGRISQICGGKDIVSGSVGIDNVRFETTSEWDTAVKKAVFYVDKDNVYEAFVNDDNTAEVPYEVIKDIAVLKIGMYGVFSDGTVITASVVEIELREGVVREISTSPGKYEDIYTQVLQKYAEIYEKILCTTEELTFTEADNTTPDKVQSIAPGLTSKVFTSGYIKTDCEYIVIKKKSATLTYLVFYKKDTDGADQQFNVAFHTSNELEERIDVREIDEIKFEIRGKGAYDADPETYIFHKVKFVSTAIEELSDNMSKEIENINIIKSDKIYVEHIGFVVPDILSSSNIKTYPTYDGMEYEIDIEEDGDIICYFGFMDNDNNSVELIPVYSNKGTITDVDFTIATKVSILSSRDIQVNLKFKELLTTDTFNKYLNLKANKTELDNYVPITRKMAGYQLTGDIIANELAGTIAVEFAKGGSWYSVLIPWLQKQCGSKSQQDINTEAINVLNGTDEGSVVKTVIDQIAKVVAGAPEDFDTLKELSDWISNHTDDASAMNSKILENTERLNTVIEELPNGYVQKTRTIAGLPLKEDISAETLIDTLYNAQLFSTRVAQAFLNMYNVAIKNTIEQTITQHTDVAGNTTARHTHSNKAVLDKITAVDMLLSATSNNPIANSAVYKIQQILQEDINANYEDILALQKKDTWELILDKTLPASSDNGTLIDFTDMELDGTYKELRIVTALWNSASTGDIQLFVNSMDEPIATLKNVIQYGATYSFDFTLSNNDVFKGHYIVMSLKKSLTGVNATNSVETSYINSSTDSTVPDIQSITNLKLRMAAGWNNSTERYVRVYGRK